MTVTTQTLSPDRMLLKRLRYIESIARTGLDSDGYTMAMDVAISLVGKEAESGIAEYEARCNGGAVSVSTLFIVFSGVYDNWGPVVAYTKREDAEAFIKEYDPNGEKEADIWEEDFDISFAEWQAKYGRLPSEVT